MKHDTTTRAYSNHRSSSSMVGETHTVVRVGYQGEPGAFSEEAISAQFGDRAQAVPYPRFDDVGRSLRNGDIGFAMLPIENSRIGVIEDAAAVIERYALREMGSHDLSVRHCLLGMADARVENIHTVRSQPAALAQCASFLRARAWLRVEPVHDTAAAAREVARARDATNAAIASRAAANRHGLFVIAADIQDDRENRTRFVILAP